MNKNKNIQVGDTVWLSDYACRIIKGKVLDIEHTSHGVYVTVKTSRHTNSVDLIDIHLSKAECIQAEIEHCWTMVKRYKRKIISLTKRLNKELNKEGK